MMGKRNRKKTKIEKKLNMIDQNESGRLGSQNIVTTRHFITKQKMGAANKGRVWTQEEVAAYNEKT